MAQEKKCSVCDKPKEKVYPYPSVTGQEIFACRSCISSGYQPRWAIILGARYYGRDAVWELVEKKKYHGKDITAQELGNE